MKEHIILSSLEDTQKLAARIAEGARGGMILALSGPIGAGKTTFVKALAAEFKIAETVVSPTYTLLQPYTLPVARGGISTLVHIDAYRLESADELRAIGVEDFLNDSTCFVVIEWAEKVESVLTSRDVMHMNFEVSENKRSVTIIKN